MHIEAKHKANKIAQKKAKKKKEKVELESKFYEIKENKSDEQVRRECEELRKRLANNELGKEKEEGLTEEEYMNMIFGN